MALKDILKQIGGKLVVNPAGQDERGKGNVFKQSELPWYIEKEEEKDPFFSPILLDPERADGIYPYRLIVIDVKTNSPVISDGKTSPSGRNSEVVKNKSNTGGVQYIYGGARSEWILRLPITPQQLSITDQFAINTSATMRGVVEEHNGVKFKTITASGTTGIWPSRDSLEDPNTGTGISLFGGTVEAIGGAARAFNRLVKGGNPEPLGLDFRKDNGGTKTGYFQAMLIQQFLEQYAMAKKNPANKHWRLVFDCPKTNESFIVTPVQYSVNRNQRSPGEFLYNMQFKAWKRVDLKQPGVLPAGKGLQPIDSNFFQRINTALDNARSLMGASSNVIKAVRSDARKPFDTLRKVTLLVKDFSGILVSVADLPSKIGQDINSATRKRARDLAQSESNFEAVFGRIKSRNKKSEQKIRTALSIINKDSRNNEGLSSNEVDNRQNGIIARDISRISPVNNIFNNPEENFDLLSGILIDDLDLTSEQISNIQEEIEFNSLISVEELREFVQDLQELLLDLTDSFGAGDEFFSEIFDRPSPKKRAIPMTEEEFELVVALEEVVLNLNILTSTREFDNLRIQSTLQYVGGLAEDSDIPFNSNYSAKILAPVPFGLNIQQISARYLGNPDLYNEIVTLNNLKFPYIDEEGFFYNLISNGDGRQFNIESKNNLYVGQKIQLSSNTISTFVRKIIEIEKITDSNYLVTVDGIADLNLLKISDNAKVKAFLPGTVNSQNQIWIPTNKPLPDEPQAYDIPFLEGDTLTGVSKIDWLLQDSGDIVLNSFGEAGLANGVTNLVQAMKMKIITQKGAILSESTFGLGLSPGINVTDTTVEEIVKDLEDMVVQDSRFQGVNNIEIEILPPELSIKVDAILVNGKGIFPINFSVPI